MRLPDFHAALALIRLREQMGISFIPELPPVKFVRQTSENRVIETTDRNDEQLVTDLQENGREVSDRDLIPDTRGLLTVGGRKVVAYIRDQRGSVDKFNQTSGYRFHLCDCATMKAMRASGRENRYLASQRTDGWFPVNYRAAWGAQQHTLLRLDLCHFCRQELRYLGLLTDPFSIQQYFQQHESRVPKTIRRIETVTQVQEYQPNQRDLSRKYREAVDYRCQRCQVHCHTHQHLLHLHHRDGDRSNNARDNLRILCIECHMEQPYHSQMKRLDQNKRAVQQIRHLRQAQGMPEFPENPVRVPSLNDRNAESPVLAPVISRATDNRTAESPA